MENVSKIDILRYMDESSEKTVDEVVNEMPLNIFVNNQYYSTLMCSPSETRELCIGFLFSEGLITSRDEILSMEFSTDDILFINLNKNIEISNQPVRTIISGCGKGITHINMIAQNDMRTVSNSSIFNAKYILESMKDFSNMSELFHDTGGVHSCCICGENGIEMMSEDIGRHNAIDKTIGKCILNNIDMKSKMLFTSGRISSDSVIKAAKADIPVLVSHSAPTDLAIKLAMKLNMTLIGFARGRRMNIYCGFNRII